MKPRMILPKYQLEEKVYAFLKTGLSLVTVRNIEINISSSGTTINYLFDEVRDYEPFDESLITNSYQNAQSKLAANQAALQLAIF